MSKSLVNINFYEQNIKVELPNSYSQFLSCLCSLLQIEPNAIKNFQITYVNLSNSQIQSINNVFDYTNFLNVLYKGHTHEMKIELSNNYEIKKEEEGDSNKENDKIKLQENEDEELFKLSFIKDDDDKDNNSNNNIKNKKSNPKEEINKIINEQIKLSQLAIDFMMKCDFCLKNEIKGILYYCQNCKKFFCSQCESKIGPIHPHCYYKIKNKEQYTQILELHKKIMNSIIERKEKEGVGIHFLSEGSKILGNTLKNLKNFFSSDDNHQNHNNQNDEQELNNPYMINRNNNYEINNVNNNERDNNLKKLVEEARSQYNLNGISDQDIERELLAANGNIDEAVSELLLKN